MADVHSKAGRSRNMAAIKGKDTKPELVVRRLVHRLGFRYGLHCRDLPGKPDLVFRSRRKILFVHGCFWHMHDCRFGRVVPQTRTDFWQGKRLSNLDRDRKAVEALSRLGWSIHVVWECELRDMVSLQSRLRGFLSGA